MSSFFLARKYQVAGVFAVEECLANMIGFDFQFFFRNKHMMCMCSHPPPLLGLLVPPVAILLVSIYLS